MIAAFGESSRRSHSLLFAVSLNSKRAVAKRIKETINRQRIYPLHWGNREEILDGAAPIVQRPPVIH
jgi:hypothetical protein